MSVYQKKEEEETPQTQNTNFLTITGMIDFISYGHHHSSSLFALRIENTGQQQFARSKNTVSALNTHRNK